MRSKSARGPACGVRAAKWLRKRAAGKEEMPLAALRRGGVEYVELRSLDVDVFRSAGVGEAQLKFIEMLAFFCLLSQSPPIGDDERKAIDRNEIAAAHDGRAPGLKLNRGGREQTLADWGLRYATGCGRCVSCLMVVVMAAMAAAATALAVAAAAAAAAVTLMRCASRPGVSGSLICARRRECLTR